MLCIWLKFSNKTAELLPSSPKTVMIPIKYLMYIIYKSDLSNEVLHLLVGQEGAKISEVKVGGQKKSARSAGPRVHRVRDRLRWKFLTDLQLWPLIFLQPLHLQEQTVPHLKNLINICFEIECQGHEMTFNLIYVRSNYPHFISYRGLC